MLIILFIFLLTFSYKELLEKVCKKRENFSAVANNERNENIPENKIETIFDKETKIITNVFEKYNVSNKVEVPLDSFVQVNFVNPSLEQKILIFLKDEINLLFEKVKVQIFEQIYNMSESNDILKFDTKIILYSTSDSGFFNFTSRDIRCVLSIENFLKKRIRFWF